ncbi:MAG TPA: choice-of-anchor tandem repeat GloVer-containing protein [Verrucomicrobiae bacterium]
MADRFHVSRLLCLLAAWGWMAATPAHAAETHSRKPAKTLLRPGQDPRRVAVTFRDGLDVRLRGNTLVSTNARLFAASRSLFDSLSAGTWQRADAVPEDTIDQMRQRAEQRLGRTLPDLNLQFYLALPPGLDAAAVIDSLNQLDIVDLAQPVPRCAPAPLPPDFTPAQLHCETAPIGGSIFDAWTNYGVFGASVWVGDVEYSYNPSHQDLPAVVNLDSDAVDPFNDDNHGTATIGEIGALANGWGTAGIAYGADAFYFAGANYSSGYDAGRGITTAASQLREGDIMLIEQQLDGPNTPQDVEDLGGEYSLIPIEWFEPYYDRIVMAAGLGIVVIETAGNGGQNLDDPIYSTGNGGHWPFLPQNNSGAILVGAGASYNGSSTESSRLNYSNYGSRLDMQGWGENIVTTGYGDLYSAEGPNLFYTATFGGTSGAAPIVVGEAALLQSIYENATGQLLSSDRIKTLLRNTGTPQTGGAYTSFENIGPLPNLNLAVSTALSNTGPPVIVARTDTATGRIGGTVTLSVAASGAQPMAFQWKFFNTNLTDSAFVSGSSTADLILNNLAPSQGGAYAFTVSNADGIASAACDLSIVSDPALTPGVTLTNLYTFTEELDGSGPAGLTPDGLGNLYGVQQYGGTNGDGGIYEFTPSTQTFTVLYSFTNGVDGANPFVPMIMGSDGNLYGTTSDGGDSGYGTIFSFTPGGGLTPLHSFTGGSDGAYPHATLVEGPNQIFYGTAYAGGMGADYGVIYSVDSSGNYNVIHTFGFTDGGGPYGGLVLAGDGNFYGTASYGGANNDGAIFRLSPSGAFTNLFSFSDTNGSSPSGNLVQGMDGTLYGQTYYGGVPRLGTVFSFTTNGSFQPLHAFNGPDGSHPYSALLPGRDGNLYGLSEYGGANDQDGVVYEISPGGAFNIVAHFDGLTGINPYAPLVRGDDGNFYGTTFEGGYGGGVIFELSFASTPRPSFTGAAASSGIISLTASALPGRSYQLQTTADLSRPWVSSGNVLAAANSTISVTDAVSRTGQKYYRLILVPP